MRETALKLAIDKVLLKSTLTGQGMTVIQRCVKDKCK